MPDAPLRADAARDAPQTAGVQERPDAHGESRTAATAPAGASRRMDRNLVLLLTVATGVAVASSYYIQPLLPEVRQTFHVGSGAAGLIVTVGQIAYAAGLVFLLPLGDLVERRRLVVGLSALTVLGLVGMAVSPAIGALYVAVAVVGSTSVVAQILVAFAASLAGDTERGRVVGTIMSGLLIGILLARTVAGYLAALLGWRGVFYVAAGLVAVQAAVLWRSLPRYRGSVDLAYGKVLASVARIFAEQPVLRRRAVYGALSFGAFSVLWTSLAFLLAGAPYHYGSVLIGLFGLIGATGAAMALVAGRLADRGLQAAVTLASSVATAVAFGLLWLGAHDLAVLVVAIVLLDLGCQGLHITNQSEIYRLLPNARSRVNAAYMTSYFFGGTLGSVGSALCYATYGWGGVCVLGAAFGVVALGLATGERRFERRRAAATVPLVAG